MSVPIARMGPSDLVGFELLVRESEKEGYGFLRRMVHEWASGDLTFSSPGECAAIAQEHGCVVGVGGLCRDPYLTADDVGRVRHMYVHPGHRSSGLGVRLLEFVLSGWKENFSRVRLRAANEGSARFYESHGFQAVAGEDNCTHVLISS